MPVAASDIIGHVQPWLSGAAWLTVGCYAGKLHMWLRLSGRARTAEGRLAAMKQALG